MTYTLSGTYLGERITVTWDEQTSSLVGDETLWAAVVKRAKSPLSLTPTGPTLRNPDPSLPGHACALASELMRVQSVMGDVPIAPEGIEPDQDVPGDAVY